jgi:hypothetical protein
MNGAVTKEPTVTVIMSEEFIAEDCYVHPVSQPNLDGHGFKDDREVKTVVTR